MSALCTSDFIAAWAAKLQAAADDFPAIAFDGRLDELAPALDAGGRA